MFINTKFYEKPNKTTLYLRGYTFKHSPNESNKTVIVYRRKFYVARKLRSKEEYGILRYLTNWNLDKENHSVSGVFSWANREFLWKGWKDFGIAHCQSKDYFCKFCVSFENSEKVREITQFSNNFVVYTETLPRFHSTNACMDQVQPGLLQGWF